MDHIQSPWDQNTSATDSPLSVGLISEEGCNSEELDEFIIDDFPSSSLPHNSSSYSACGALNSMDIQDELIMMEQSLNMPKTLPNDDYFKTLSPPHTPGGTLVRPSTSCPADIARIKQMSGQRLTDDEIKLILKDRQKKDNHNMSKLLSKSFKT